MSKTKNGDSAPTSGSVSPHPLTQWEDLKMQLYAKRIEARDPKICTFETEDQIDHDINVLEHRLMTMPAFEDWVLFEKFQLFRQILGHEFEVFTDRREWIFLAALEADAIRLAGAAAKLKG